MKVRKLFLFFFVIVAVAALHQIPDDMAEFYEKFEAQQVELKRQQEQQNSLAYLLAKVDIASLKQADAIQNEIGILKEKDQKLEKQLQSLNDELKSHQTDLCSTAEKVEDIVSSRDALINSSLIAQNKDIADRLTNLESDLLAGKRERAILNDTINKMTAETKAARHTLERIEHLSQLQTEQYLTLSAALQDMKQKESAKLEETLKSRLLDIHPLLNLLVQNEVHEAAETGNTERLLELLSAGASTEFEDSNKNRPVHVATKNSYVNVVEALLDYKANPNAHGQDGYTPLHLTAYYGCLGCAKLLLVHGADVDRRDNWLDTPLIKGAKHGYTELVKLLLDNGANINAVQQNNYTALHMASRDGRTETVKILMHRGADHNLKTHGGQTALDLATQKYHYDIMRILNSK